MSREQELLAEVERLRAAIIKHRSQKADDRCIEDDDELYAALGDGIPCDRRVGDKDAMLANCKRFIERRCEGGGWPSYIEMEAELVRLRLALTKINEIRNSIIGLATVNWSEHIYPLVAALQEAGIEGMAYPEAREYFGTLLERTNTAEARIAEIEALAERCRRKLEDLWSASGTFMSLIVMSSLSSEAREAGHALSEERHIIRNQLDDDAALLKSLLLETRDAHWEAVPDEPHPEDEKGGRFWRVRWSEPDTEGRYLYVRHYGGNGSAWNQNAAEGDAKRMNEQGRRPSEWR